MISELKIGDQYIDELPEDRKESMNKLRNTILQNIPKGFKEIVDGKMLSYVVPHDIYPDGYHCNPQQPLPFVSIASQKNFIALYHMGIYVMPDLLSWFTNEYSKHATTKLDMGKSCIRFKKVEHIPYKLIGELMKKISVDDYIKTYEKVLKKNV